MRADAAIVTGLGAISAAGSNVAGHVAWRGFGACFHPFEALAAGWRGVTSEIPPEPHGVFIGMGHGPLEAGFQFLDGIRADGKAQAPPTLFFHSVHTMAAGDLSSCLGLLGPMLTLQSDGRPFLTALLEGLRCATGDTKPRRVEDAMGRADIIWREDS